VVRNESEPKAVLRSVIRARRATVLIVVALALAGCDGPDSTTTSSVGTGGTELTVPQVIGLPARAARQALESEGFRVRAIYRSSRRRGVVVHAQMPSAGTTTRPGTTVVIRLSARS
jgi:beta-lactam-binding protein with PASTA domain